MSSQRKTSGEQTDQLSQKPIAIHSSYQSENVMPVIYCATWEEEGDANIDLTSINGVCFVYLFIYFVGLHDHPTQCDSK